MSVENLTRQILSQGTMGGWTGEGFGSPEANAREMANVLSSAGITDIRDFGRIKKTVYSQTPVQAEFEYTNYGVFPTGRYYIADPESGSRSYVDASQVKTGERTEGYYGADEAPPTVSYNYINTPTETTVFGNKKTGQEINPNYNRAGGNVFSGTYIGKGRTNFNVEFGPDGTPYFYTQYGGSTSSLKDIAPILSIGLALFAPGIGGAIGSALTGAAASTVASQVIGAAVVQGVLAEAQGGDFLDGAIRGAVTAGVAPVVANTVGTAVADIMADSAVKNIVANAVASSASSAVTAALTGGDVEQAALTGALGGAGGSIGRELGTAAELGTTPFSQQTQMLAGQEQGLATGGSAGSQLGQALGVIGAGSDPSQSLTNALLNFYQEQVRATPDTGSSGVVSPAVPDQTAQAKEEELLVPGAENVAQMVLAPQGETVAGQPGFTPDFVAAMPQMQPRENEEAGPVVSDTFDSGETFFYREIKATLPDGTSRYYRITYDPSARSPFSYSGSYGENQLFESFNRPEFNVDAQAGDTASAGVATPESVAPTEAPPSFVPEQVNILDLIAADRGVAAPEISFTPPTESTFTPVPEVSEPVSGGQIDVSGAPVVTTPEVPTEITPPSTQEILIPDQISQELGGVQGDIFEPIPPVDQEVIDLITQPAEQPNLITQPSEQPVFVAPEEVAPAPPEDFFVQPGVVETIPEDLGFQGGIDETIPEDLVLQEDVVETIPEDLGLQEVISETIPEEEVGIPEDIVEAAPQEDTGVQEGVAGTIPENLEPVTTTPYIRDFYLSSGRRRPTMGPTVYNLGQALSAPFFPSSPVSGLTSYRGAGEIESQQTGKPRRDVWNEASLRLKDALGL